MCFSFPSCFGLFVSSPLTLPLAEALGPTENDRMASGVWAGAPSASTRRVRPLVSLSPKPTKAGCCRTAVDWGHRCVPIAARCRASNDQTVLAGPSGRRRNACPRRRVEDPVVAILLLRAPEAIGTTLKFLHFGSLATAPENSTVSIVCTVSLKPSD